MGGGQRLVVFAAAALLAGCGTFRPNPGRLQAWSAAAHAGQFHRINGRWPADARELASLPCPRLDEMNEQEFLSRAPAAPCDFVATLPYRIELLTRGESLAMTFRAADGREACKLTVAVPAPNPATISPMVRIHTTVFACPGEGEFR